VLEAALGMSISNIPDDAIEWFSFKPKLNMGSKPGKTSEVDGNICESAHL
jgi:hypothetical protein